MATPYDVIIVGSEEQDLATQVYDLLRHYAGRRRHDPEMLEALSESTDDLAGLVARGLVNDAVSTNNPYSVILRAQVELWWMDLEMGLHVVPKLRPMLPDGWWDRLRADSLALIERLDKGSRPAAWEGVAHIFSSVVSDDADTENYERSRVLARGVGTAVAMSDDWLAQALDLVHRGPSRGLLCALARDTILVEHERWIAALLLRGGPLAVALGAATVYFAPDETTVHIRDLLAVAPPSCMIRVAEAHGLLTLLGDDAVDCTEALRTAFLTQAWQGGFQEGATSVQWSRAFRGELLVSRSLSELGDSAALMARDVAVGLAHHIGNDSALNDPQRRQAIAECLAWVLKDDDEYVAPLRCAESVLRELGRTHGTQPMACAMRGYADALIATARVLRSTTGGRSPARRLYSRVLRLRKANPRMLPRDVFPDTLDRALELGGADRDAARWLEPDLVFLDDRDAPAPTPIDPLPRAGEIVATAEGVLPLPGLTAAWVNARGWSYSRLITWLLPLPFRHMVTVMAGWLGLTSRAQFVMGSNNKGAVVVHRRFFGKRWGVTKRAIVGGQLFTFPDEECLGVDRMMGRWSSILLLTGTLGTWITLKGIQAGAVAETLGGSCILLFGLLGYHGALSLYRILADGNAVAVRDDQDQVRVWRIEPGTRAMLMERGQTETDPA